MRRVLRGEGTAPAVLTATGRDGRTELERARAHFGKQAIAGHVARSRRKPPSGTGEFAFGAYKANAVKAALDRLFHGKCAYCETFYSASSPVDVEHFRPKSAVLEDPSHPGYWWLAAQWENLLPSCIDCNRSRQQVLLDAGQDPSTVTGAPLGSGTLAGKGSRFPLMPGSPRLQPEASPVGNERPLLLNPCEDDPARHLQFVGHASPASSLVAARRNSARGKASIALYGLNRLGLVQDRTRLLRQLQMMGDQVLRLARLADRHRDPELQALMLQNVDAMIAMGAAERPYSAMVRAWLDDFTATL